MSDINDTQMPGGGASATSTGKTGKQPAVSPPVIAGFEILNKIGQGGMGSVFRARQISMDRIVALKILPKRLAQDPQFKERFLREARLSAKLNHSNLINGIECGESGGYTFFAMEFVDGKTAKQVLEQKQHIDSAEALDIIRQISEALAYAHSRQLIHRDVKPENIMVTSAGQAKLCDLGLARSMEDSPSDAHLTQAGQAVGTPFYISPEQAKGLKDIDVRTDIYSLGATFYHLLASQPPFQAPTSAAVMVKHLTETAPAVCEVADDVPAEFAMVVSKMMAKAPIDRYADMAAVIRDLDALRDGKLPAAAEFRGKTSCAMPSRTAARQGLSDNSTASRRTAPVGPQTGRSKTKVPTKDSPANMGMLIGGGVLVVLVLLFLMNSGKSNSNSNSVAEIKRDSQPVPLPKPNPVSVPKPAPQINPIAKPLPTVTKTTDPSGSPDTVAQILNPTPVKKTDPTETATAENPPKVDPAAVKTDPETKTDPATAVKTDPAATPAGDPQADQAYLKFLVEVTRKATTLPLSKVEKEAHDLAAKPEYAPGKDVIAAELKDLEAATKFEIAALEEMGKSARVLDLPADHPIRKFGGQVKVDKYDSTRGLQVTVGGANMQLNSATLPPKTIVEFSNTRIGPLVASYYIYRGDKAEAQNLIKVMNPQDRPPLERKIELLKTGDAELSARAAYTNLLGLKTAKKWKECQDGISAFEKNFAETAVALEKKEELAALKDLVEEMLNPLAKVFFAKTAKQLPDGFIELTYDFSTPQQAQAFACEHDKLTIEDGRLHVPAGGGEFAMARFIAPIVELRHLDTTGKTLSDAPRLGIYFIPPGTNMTDLSRVPRCALFRANHLAQLLFWQNANARGQNFMGSQSQNWTSDLTFALDVKDEGAVWTVGGEELKPVKLPKSAIGGNFALVSRDGDHSWTDFKIIFKTDPAWIAQQRAKKPDNK